MASVQVFDGFCEGEGLDVTTRRLLDEVGISNVRDLALLTDAVIDTDLHGIILGQRLKLKETAKRARTENASLPSGCALRLDRALPDSESKESDVRMVLLGKTGTGKSRSGNTILNYLRFQQSTDIMDALTATCSRRSVKINGVNIRVVDTPGIMDPSRKMGEVTHEVSRCLDMTSPGPHVFLFVLQLMMRITEEDMTTYTKLRETFGANLNRYTIVVFTRGDKLQEHNTTIEKVLAHDNPILTRILTDVENKYVVFNNKETNPEANDRQVGNLLIMIAELRENNVVQPYFRDEQAARITRRMDRQIDEYVRRHPGVGLHKAYEAVRKRNIIRLGVGVGLVVLTVATVLGIAVSRNK